MQLRSIFYSAIGLTLLIACSVDGTFPRAPFPHALGGLVTDIAMNPLGILIILAIKKLILLKLGLLLLGKRSVDEPVSTTMPTAEISAADYESMAVSLDTNGCIARLICEIMTNKEGNSTFEKSIIKYFGGEMSDENKIPPTGRSIFHYAAFMGKTAKSEDSCGIIFAKCERAMSEVRNTANVAFDLDI